VKQIIASVTEGLKASPLALALVVINLLFLAWGVHVLNAVSEAGVRRDALLTQLVEKCR